MSDNLQDILLLALLAATVVNAAVTWYTYRKTKQFSK